MDLGLPGDGVQSVAFPRRAEAGKWGVQVGLLGVASCCSSWVRPGTALPLPKGSLLTLISALSWEPGRPQHEPRNPWSHPGTVPAPRGGKTTACCLHTSPLPREGKQSRSLDDPPQGPSPWRPPGRMHQCHLVPTDPWACPHGVPEGRALLSSAGPIPPHASSLLAEILEV